MDNKILVPTLFLFLWYTIIWYDATQMDIFLGTIGLQWTCIIFLLDGIGLGLVIAWFVYRL